MALINLPIDLGRTAAALEDIASVLSKISVALERLAPEPPLFTSAPHIAGLSDLRRTDPDTVGKIQSELEVFAQNQNVVINSEAFLNSIIKYEQDVAQAYGDDAVAELPWNKAAGGTLFRKKEEEERRP
jgi:hypothetical protein